MEGEAAETIVRCARETGADLIMMPTRGQTRFRSLMLGSVTTSVLHDAECPVWTSAHSEIDTQPSKYRSILCAVDLSPSSLTVLRRAGQLAQAWAASLYAVHAVPEQSSPNVLMAARGTARSKFVPIAEEAGLDLKLEIIAGPVAEVVRAEATRHGADLVVAGRGQIQGAFGRLRNNIHDIIRTAPCPVLSV
jgi:nucleotide-binding universal stress UspA family protein